MIDFCYTSIADGLHPDPEITVTEWADRYRYLPRESSVEPGRYRSDRTPYLREIMDSLSNTDPCQDIGFIKATQIGATEAGNNWFGYVVDSAPGPMLMILPTLELSKDHSRQKIEPTIRDTPALSAKISEKKSKDGGHTMLTKEFPGGILFLGGANSPAGFRSKSIRYLFMDDVDGYPIDAGGEGDPVALAKKRTDSFGIWRKIFAASTPTTTETSRIQRIFDESDQRYYHVPCPHCGYMQPLEWGGPDEPHGIKFARDDHGQPIDVWYECAGCHQRIDEHHKTGMLAAGEWVPTHPEVKNKGYHLNGLYSPLGWVSWEQIVKEFLEAKRDRNKVALKVWLNTRLALTFEEEASKVDWQTAKFGAGGYSQYAVPAGALILTAGIDTQDNRLSASVWGWGEGEESWLICRVVFWGDPAQPEVWQQLDMLLNKGFEHESGAILRISAAAIDSQGHRTQSVYNYCRTRGPRVIAVQGSSTPARPVIGKPSDQDVAFEGQRIKNGVKLWPVGSDTAKSILYAFLQRREIVEDQERPWVHFPTGMPDSYFRELTAEKLMPTKNKTTGKEKLQWVLPAGARNEALDEWVYAYAAAHHIHLPLQDFTDLHRKIVGGKKQTKPPAQAKGRAKPPLERGEFEAPEWLLNR